MAKLAIRFFMFLMLTTSLLVLPVVTPAEAATSGKHIKKKVRVTHHSQRVAKPLANPYSNNPYEDDFDRKNAGGGGGY